MGKESLVFESVISLGVFYFHFRNQLFYIWELILESELS